MTSAATWALIAVFFGYSGMVLIATWVGIYRAGR